MSSRFCGGCSWKIGLKHYSRVIQVGALIVAVVVLVLMVVVGVQGRQLQDATTMTTTTTMVIVSTGMTDEELLP